MMWNTDWSEARDVKSCVRPVTIEGVMELPLDPRVRVILTAVLARETRYSDVSWMTFHSLCFGIGSEEFDDADFVVGGVDFAEPCDDD